MLGNTSLRLTQKNSCLPRFCHQGGIVFFLSKAELYLTVLSLTVLFVVLLAPIGRFSAAQAQGSAVTALDNYPRITAMEIAILGQSYVADALPARLARMEVKAFGKVSNVVLFISFNR